MTTPTNNLLQALDGLPMDLREWVGERGLVKLALDAVQTVVARRPDFGASRAGDPSPQVMLTLLAYCYAAGIYGSEEIADAARVDATVRYICLHNQPRSERIRRFRKAHRQLVELSLACIFTEAWKLKRAESEPHLLFSLRLDAHAYCQILRTVRRKLQIAVNLDSVAAE